MTHDMLRPVAEMSEADPLIGRLVGQKFRIDRLLDFKKLRGFTNLPFVSDMSGDYTRTYVSPDDADVPGFVVFTRRNGKVFHYYSGEMSGAMADPGQDPLAALGYPQHTLVVAAGAGQAHRQPPGGFVKWLDRQDPRGAPDFDPLWLMLDLTPEGRGTDWYPKLQYNHK